ncbi:hypothetical protein GGS21DRAFT_493806 [Xylaria nigripes]|nr:hypothetical protein GGS21DRAFT_493806 [Xylaria nigripes]
MSVVSKCVILTLPAEILDSIVIEYGLSRDDLKALRLTCKAFNQVATPALRYNRVILSRLKEDREALENLVQSGEQARYLSSGSLTLNVGFEPVLVAHDPAVFWLPYCHTINTAFIQFAGGMSINSVTGWLRQAVKRMANLTTITFVQMPDERRFMHGGRIHNAREFLFHAIVEQREHGSLGLACVLPLLHEAKAKAHTLNIVEGLSRFTLNAITLDDKTAFKRLTSINLCLSLNFVHSEAYSKTTVTCLKAATGLHQMKLCFRPAMRTCPNALHSVNQFLPTLFDGAHWPQLTSLILMNTPIPGQICWGHRFVQSAQHGLGFEAMLPSQHHVAPHPPTSMVGLDGLQYPLFFPPRNEPGALGIFHYNNPHFYFSPALITEAVAHPWQFLAYEDRQGECKCCMKKNR